MKRRPFLFALSFSLPVFFGMAAGAGRPLVRVAPSLAVSAPAVGPVAAAPGGRFGRNLVFQYELTPEARDSKDFPVVLSGIEVTVFSHPDDAKPPDVQRLPLPRDPLRSVRFSIPGGGHAVLRAVAEDGTLSEPIDRGWMPSRHGCIVDHRRLNGLKLTFRFPAR